MSDTSQVNGSRIPQWAAKSAFGVIGSVALVLGIYSVSGVSDLDGKYKALSISHQAAIETGKVTMNAIIETARINNEFMKERFLEVKSDLRIIQSRLQGLKDLPSFKKEE